MRPALSKVRRLIVKIGSSLLTDGGARLDVDYIFQLCAQVSQAKNKGCEIVVVSSGAVAAGIQALKWQRDSLAQADIQTAAAVGQMRLMDVFEEGFSRYQLHAGQVLLTAEDMAHRALYLNARSALRRMLERKVIPVINENDVIAIDSIRFGDNDRLAAQIANLTEADLLLMLTDADGLRTDGGKGDIIRQATADDDSLQQHVSSITAGVGSGGMGSKLNAARVAARSGAHSLIASGHDTAALMRALSGDENYGTLLLANTPRLSARKQWLASGLNVCGGMLLDNGAVRALIKDKKSLLPAGIKSIYGDFERGDSVALKSEAGEIVGYALVNYDSRAAARLRGVKSADIVKTIGYMHEEEMAHRDNISVVATK